MVDNAMVMESHPIWPCLFLVPGHESNDDSVVSLPRSVQLGPVGIRVVFQCLSLGVYQFRRLLPFFWDSKRFQYLVDESPAFAF